jgi:type IV pilus assembly protein PilB
MLLKNRLITRKDIVERIPEAEESGTSILNLLLKDGIVTQEQIKWIFHGEWGFDIYHARKDRIDQSVLELLKKEEAQKYLVFPLNQEGNETLVVIMADPTDEETLRSLQRITNMRLKILVAEKDCIQSLIQKYYHKNQMPQKKSGDLRQKGNASKEFSIVTLVNQMIEEAVSQGVSDVHIESLPKKIQIRFRIDGILQPVKFLEASTWQGMVTRLKILGGCDIAEHRLPQDGAFSTQYEGRQIDVRLSIVPTINGEKVVLRLLDQQKFLLTVDKLGFSEDQQRLLGEIMDSPHGMILAAGPTGSGKTTTLYSLLNGIDPQTQNIVTIEDPVEFQMNDVNQIQVNERTGLTFAVGLRAVLRQDPNVIMVGEIRDEEAAAIAIRASITGHFVLSTIHTNNTIASITRLLDMNIPPYLLSAAVRGVISQKLIKRLCPNCRKKELATEEEKAFLGVKESKLSLFHPVGCPLCHGSGYRGRIAVQEVLKITRRIREAISNGSDYDAIREIALREGLIPMEASLKGHLFAGHTSLAEGMEILAFENEWHHR